MSSSSSYSSSSSSSSSFFNFFAKFESKGPRIHFAKRKLSLNRFYWSIIIIVNIKGKCRDHITVSLKTKILFVKLIIMYISFSVYSFFSSFVVPLLCFFFFSPVNSLTFTFFHFDLLTYFLIIIVTWPITSFLSSGIFSCAIAKTDWLTDGLTDWLTD